MHKWTTSWVIFYLACTAMYAQKPDSTATEEEDYSQYENAGFADGSAKRFANPKILDLSPQRLISIGWDMQMPYSAQFSGMGSFAVDENWSAAERGTFSYTGGLRFGANIPVISKNSLVWQLGASYWDTQYRSNEPPTREGGSRMLDRLQENGLKTLGLNTTVYKPLNEMQFLLFQGALDLNGDFSLSNFQSLQYTRWSGALVWGKRPNDRKQWGFGVARTYRVGELNYFPVVMYNWTAPSRKWGVEMLFPARAHVRRTFNARNLLLAGYELEGQTYRLNSLSNANNDYELRRGEARARVEYQRQLSGFVWLSVQAGWRYNWRFDVDRVQDGKDFFRGFFGDQRYAKLANLGNPLYFNIGIHLVSP